MIKKRGSVIRQGFASCLLLTAFDQWCSLSFLFLSTKSLILFFFFSFIVFPALKLNIRRSPPPTHRLPSLPTDHFFDVFLALFVFVLLSVVWASKNQISHPSIPHYLRVVLKSRFLFCFSQKPLLYFVLLFRSAVERVLWNDTTDAAYKKNLLGSSIHKSPLTKHERNLGSSEQLFPIFFISLFLYLLVACLFLISLRNWFRAFLLHSPPTKTKIFTNALYPLKWGSVLLVKLARFLNVPTHVSFTMMPTIEEGLVVYSFYLFFMTIACRESAFNGSVEHKIEIKRYFSYL